MNGTPACAGPAKQWLSTGACETGPTSPEGSARPAGRPTSFQRKAQTPLPSEPILIPKLRIQFADFPYLHYSIDQRLFTLETCCGYGYGLARDLHLLARIFKGRRELTGRRRNRDAFQGAGPSLGTNPFQGALPFTKKRELFPGLPPASPGSFALPHWAPRGACLRLPGSGI